MLLAHVFIKPFKEGISVSKLSAVSLYQYNFCIQSNNFFSWARTPGYICNGADLVLTIFVIILPIMAAGSEIGTWIKLNPEEIK